MVGVFWKSLMLGAVALFLVGCGEDQSTVQTSDSSTKALRQQVADLDASNNLLKTQLAQVQQQADVNKAEAKRWEDQYSVAQEAGARGGMGVPPGVLSKFMEIARSGKYWRYKDGVLRSKNSDILFDSGKAELKPEAQGAIQEVAGKLKEILTDKSLVLRVDGHTDSDPIVRSGWKDNTHLSLMRALAVAEALKKEGVPEGSVFVAGMGEHRPIPGAPKAKNRRVELVILPAAQTPTQ